MIYFDRQHNTYFDKSQIKEEDIVFVCEDSVWVDFCSNPDKYYWEDDKFIQNPNWEEEQAEKERECIQALSMTRSDFFDGMIMAFGLDSKELRVVVENVLNTINITDVQIRMALNNYDNALNFYRKHTLFELLSGIKIPATEEKSLFITSKQWDKFFETKDWHELVKEE